MIRFTDYRVIAEKPRVGQLGRIFFRAQEKLCVGSKNDWQLFGGVDVLYHRAKFSEHRIVGVKTLFGLETETETETETWTK